MTTCLSFLNQLTKSIASRNATEIKKHFYRSFDYMGCKKRYYLDDVVAKLSELPFQQGVFAILGSQRYYVDGYIAFNATIHGLFARPTKSEFVLFLHIGTLLTGNVIDCSVI
ncbi:hypothetical protein CAEBREN_11808 [Caenorhabditis brenneri]|uniref:NTF2-like domain-containing protein n=1 Tax=Caenorhabditis brenneri TaxID=135651 RepID=G0NDA0_CAEBE|nr:hypothetical protein CAEBREN_11808 [Caenorhabditis brenneri]